MDLLDLIFVFNLKPKMGLTAPIEPPFVNYLQHIKSESYDNHRMYLHIVSIFIDYRK